MTSFLKFFSLVFLLTLFSACNDSSPDKLVTSFSDDVNNSFLITNRSLQINVFENFDDGSQNNITNELIWSSSNESLATVTNGLIEAKSSLGMVVISYQSEALLNNGEPVVNSNIQLEVKDLLLLNIILSKIQVSLSVGASTNVIAYGLFDDGSTLDVSDSVTWVSENTSICSAQTGTIVGIGEGTTTVVATDGNITSAPVTVTVAKDFKAFSISANKYDFNVEQSITLEAKIINNNNQVLIFPNNSILWSSSDTAVISIDEEGIALALSEGNASITGSIKSDPSFTQSLSFFVLTDTYMRLFKNSVEDSFPYSNQNTYLSLPTSLDRFTIKAVGKNYIITGLKVTSLDGTLISSSNAWFENLVEGDLIIQGQSRTFELKHNANEKELVYFFRINDATLSEFSAKYIELI